jgi:hypothetical protein
LIKGFVHERGHHRTLGRADVRGEVWKRIELVLYSKLTNYVRKYLFFF